MFVFNKVLFLNLIALTWTFYYVLALWATFNDHPLPPSYRSSIWLTRLRLGSRPRHRQIPEHRNRKWGSYRKKTDGLFWCISSACTSVIVSRMDPYSGCLRSDLCERLKTERIWDWRTYVKAMFQMQTKGLVLLHCLFSREVNRKF